MKRKSPLERDILADIRDNIGMGVHAGFVLWRVNQGSGQLKNKHRVTSYQFWGVRLGCSDLLGLTLPEGRILCIETKTDRGQLRDEQRQFANIIRQLNGYFGVARSLDEAREHIERARRGEPCPDYSKQKPLASG